MKRRGKGTVKTPLQDSTAHTSNNIVLAATPGKSLESLAEWIGGGRVPASSAHSNGRAAAEKPPHCNEQLDLNLQGGFCVTPKKTNVFEGKRRRVSRPSPQS